MYLYYSRMVFKSFFALFLIVSIAGRSNAYSTGAPEETCNDMTPQHHVDPQSSQAPYTLTVSRNTIRSGDDVKLTIEGKSPQDKIKGFLIQVRQNNSNKPLGTFKVDPKDSFIQAVTCPGGEKVMRSSSASSNGFTTSCGPSPFQKVEQ